jgi:hypothetical protein
MNNALLIRRGALLVSVSTLVSGPLLFALTLLIASQPVWVDAQTAAAHHHWLQDLTYFCGFGIIGGMLMLATGNFLRARDGAKPWGLLAFAATVVFAVLISFNYIMQTTYVRNLLIDFHAEDAPMITTFSMLNPRSLAWCIEMWGYGVLGTATWLMAPLYRDTTIRRMLIANGIVSIGSALATSYDSGWLMSIVGLLSYLLWNLLLIVLTFLIYRRTTLEQSSLGVRF